MKESISKKQLREFGFLIGLGIPIIIGWGIPAILGHMFRAWTLWIGIPSLLLGILKPFVLYYPYKGWMALGHALGWINSRMILGLVFLLVLQPIALIMKFVGYDPLRQSQRERKKISFRELKTNHKINLTRIF
tara:strand:- start:15 stop:413 length:399 start_codon:yes stop_codon:yes gene_type:complete